MTSIRQFRADIERRVQLGEITRKEAFRLTRERQAQDAAAMNRALATSRFGMANAGPNGETDQETPRMRTGSDNG